MSFNLPAMFTSLSHQPNFPILEEDTLRFWKTHRIFEKASQSRQGGLPYRVIPQWPAPVHPPGLQAAVEFMFQDLYLRYKAMRGYRVSWELGWNAHGLSVELGAEARLGLAGPRQVEAYGLERFHELCRRSAFDYLLDWERLTERVGLWCDWDTLPANLPNEQIEAVWGVLKALWERSLLYTAQHCVPTCSRCATPQSTPGGHLSEVLIEQTEMLLRLPLVEEPDTALLVWTDQPWSLPGNVAVAASPDAEYVIVEHDLPEGSGGGTEKLILARQRVEDVLSGAPIRIFESFRGTRLKGLRYHPLFTYLLPDKSAYQVVLSGTVGLEPGTGLRQVSPEFDEQARQIAQTHALPVLETLASDGVFVSEIRPWRGLGLRQAVPLIVQDLQQRGLAYAVASREQLRPACPDCGAPLIDITSQGWYLRTAAARHRLASLARNVEWRPALPLLDPAAVGLAPVVDWLVSRTRSWGAPLPIWDCRSCQQSHVVGSLAELAALANADVSDLDLHGPALDSLQLACPDCGEPMKRQPGVVDPWFELGCLAIRVKEAKADQPALFSEPADLVCAVFGLPSDWLAALHLVSGLLRDESAYRQVLWLPPAHLAEPASSHEPPPTPLAQLREQGADALRWTLYLQSPDAPLQVSTEVVSQTGKGLLCAVWGLSELLGSRVDLHLLRQPPANGELPPSPQAVYLDDWLRSRLHSLIRDTTTALEAADTQAAVLALQAFVQDDLAGWYVPLRLDQRNAEPLTPESYRPLFESLIELSYLLAPPVPFLAEWLYQSLVRGLGDAGLASVHLADWPVFDPACMMPELEADMAAVRRLAALGQAARRSAAIPLHQPLAEAAFNLAEAQADRLIATYGDLLEEDLNVRAVRLVTSAEAGVILEDERHLWSVAAESSMLAALTIRLTPELVSEGLAGEFIQRVAELRQKGGLAPHERIRIVYTASPRLAEALEIHQEWIRQETQAETLQAVTQADPPRASEALKSLFTIAQFHGEKITFGIEKI